jgi:hypothetical protein
MGAGWRRAYRLAGRLDTLAVYESQKEVTVPLDTREKSGIVNAVDVNVPPDQPPSTWDSPAPEILRLGLSVTGISLENTVIEEIAFEAFTPSPFSPPAQFPVAIPVAVSPPPG